LNPFRCFLLALFFVSIFFSTSFAQHKYTIVDLGTTMPDQTGLPPREVYAKAINKHGQVVGNEVVPSSQCFYLG